MRQTSQSRSKQAQIRAAKERKLQSLLGRPLFPDDALQLRILAADLGVKLQWSRMDFKGEQAFDWREL